MSHNPSTGAVFNDTRRHDISLTRFAYKGKRIESQMQETYPPIAQPLHLVKGTAEDRNSALNLIRTRYERIITRLKLNESRNQEKLLGKHPPQNYYCIGCDIADGELRTQVLRLGAYPLLQVAMQYHLGEQLTLLCYFKQSYESSENIGPGGVLGTTKTEAPNTSYEHVAKFWEWTGDTEPAYLSETDAVNALWARTETDFNAGLNWLRTLPANIPAEGLEYPQELVHDLMALLGVTAMQKLVSVELDRDIVLLDETRIIERTHLNWALVT